MEAACLSVVAAQGSVPGSRLSLCFGSRFGLIGLLPSVTCIQLNKYLISTLSLISKSGPSPVAVWFWKERCALVYRPDEHVCLSKRL